MSKIFAIGLSLVVVSCSDAPRIDIPELMGAARVAGMKLLLDNKVETGYCSMWSLTENQIEQFFMKANVITGEQRHALYEWGGCDIVGNLVYREQQYDFGINAGGTGYIDMNGRQILFGCKKECADILDFKFYEESE